MPITCLIKLQTFEARTAIVLSDTPFHAVKDNTDGATQKRKFQARPGVRKLTLLSGAPHA